MRWLKRQELAQQVVCGDRRSTQAYSKLGLEALLTDAGWFTGGWPAGAGNWDPRRDAYPQGIGPVALAAKQRGMIYFLWFEPERVVAGTTVQKTHPDWCLSSKPGRQGTYLLNFGLPEVQDYFLRWDANRRLRRRR